MLFRSTFITDPISDYTDTIPVNDSSQLQIGNRIIIDSEVMLIKNIAGNNVIVQRAYEGSISVAHADNSFINVLTINDNLLIEPDDDFGFNESFTYFDDSRTYSPTRGIDI